MIDPIRRSGTFFRLALLAFVLCGCASAPPLRFHTLLGPVVETQSASPASYAIAVDVVSVPRQVDVPQLVVRTEGAHLKLVEDQRWAAPLAEEIRSAISGDLQADLGVADVSRVSALLETRVLRAVVDVQRFEYAQGGPVWVSAAWSVRDVATTTVLASCTTQAREPVGDGYAGLVEAYRRALSAIARQIGSGIRQAGQGYACGK
ncbi:MAG: PqiC family protein [Panacagrimonas sp.]